MHSSRQFDILKCLPFRMLRLGKEKTQGLGIEGERRSERLKRYRYLVDGKTLQHASFIASLLACLHISSFVHGRTNFD